MTRFKHTLIKGTPVMQPSLSQPQQPPDTLH